MRARFVWVSEFSRVSCVSSVGMQNVAPPPPTGVKRHLRTPCSPALPCASAAAGLALLPDADAIVAAAAGLELTPDAIAAAAAGLELTPVGAVAAAAGLALLPAAIAAAAAGLALFSVPAIATSAAGLALLPVPVAAIAAAGAGLHSHLPLPPPLCAGLHSLGPKTAASKILCGWRRRHCCCWGYIVLCVLM